MNINTRDLANYAVNKLESGSSSAEISNLIAAYLLEVRNSRELPKVMRAIERELENRGSQQVVITSAHDVSGQIKEKLASLLGAENPVFTTEIDHRVIGGVKARSGESEIDLTVRGRLNAFTSVMGGVRNG